MDFSGNGGEGDKIRIIGHTVAVKVIDGNGKISGDISSINITNTSSINCIINKCFTFTNCI